MQLEARASEASEAKAAVDAATRRLHDERATFERQQAVAAAEARALPVVTAVAVAHVAITATDEDPGGAPLRAAEFERDEGFRVLRRFLQRFRIEQHARLLQEARGWAASVPLRRHTQGRVLVESGPPPFFLDR